MTTTSVRSYIIRIMACTPLWRGALMCVVGFAALGCSGASPAAPGGSAGAVAPQGPNQLLLASHYPNRLFLFELDASGQAGQVATLDTPFAPAALAWTRDGRRDYTVGSNSIGRYAVNDSTGPLTEVAISPVELEKPSDVRIDGS